MSMMCPATADDTNTYSQNIMTLEELTTLEKLNDAFYEYSKASLWKESTQKHLSELLLNNVKLQEDLRNGRYKVSKTSDFTLNERGKSEKSKPLLSEIGLFKKCYVSRYYYRILQRLSYMIIMQVLNKEERLLQESV